MGKSYKLSVEVRIKTRESTFTTSIQHSFGSSIHSNQRKEMIGTQIGKEEVKLSLFADDMIIYIENPVESSKKLLDLISELGKIVGYKVSIQKWKIFLYSNNETSETEIGEKIPFSIATGKIMYMGIDLTN